MTRQTLALVFGVATLLPAAPAAAQLGSYNPAPGPRATVAIRGARIVPVGGAEIPNGTIVIDNGVIAAIGPDVTIPATARVIDGTGLSVYPGMMDAGTAMGLAEITQGANATVDNAETGNWNPNVQALWGIDPHSAHIGVTRVAGITHVVSRPGGSILAGQAALIHLAGYTVPDMAVVPRLATVIQLPGQGGGGGFGRGGGGGGQGGGAQAPEGRTPLDSLKQVLDDARAYGKALAARVADPALPRLTPDLALASLQPALAGEMPVLFPANTESQIKAAVEFAEEEELTPIILGGRDAWRMTEFLVEHEVPVIYTATLGMPVRDDDPYDAPYTAPARLREAGVTFAIASGESNPDVRNLPYHAGMAAAFGLDREDALRAVTLWPARIFGVDDRLGSLEVGKVANVVVTNGDILEPRTSTVHLFIDGRDVPLATKHTELYDTFKDRK